MGEIDLHRQSYSWPARAELKGAVYSARYKYLAFVMQLKVLLFLLNTSIRRFLMLMSTVDGKRVQELVNFMTLKQRQACKEKADGALIYFAATSFEGPLSKDEMLQAEEALEFLVRVEATELRRGWWYRFWRRYVLARYYFHGEALVAASRRMQEDQEWDFAFKALSAKERSKDPALQKAYDDAREALDR